MRNRITAISLSLSIYVCIASIQANAGQVQTKSDVKADVISQYQNDLKTYKEFITRFIQIIQEENKQNTDEGQGTTNIQAQLALSLTDMNQLGDEYSNKNVRLLEKSIKNIRQYLNQLSNDFVAWTLNDIIKSMNYEYGNFSTNNLALDLVKIESQDSLTNALKRNGCGTLSEFERKIERRLRKIELGTLVVCWDLSFPQYPMRYTPTKEEKSKTIEESLIFFKTNSKDDFFSYNVKRSIHCRIERPEAINKPEAKMQNYIDLKNELRNVQNFSLRNESYKQHETASSMGSIMIDKSYLITQYHDYVKTLIENVKIPKSIQKTFQVEDKPVKILDIGAATGANDLDLVKQGAIVIANDLSKSLPDLLRFRSRLTQEEKDRVWFNTNSFPDKLDQPENSFDAILLSHVAHYLTGPQIRYGFKKIYRWLKPDGKLFFQALTQYSIPFQWRRKTVANLLKLDHEWPGWFGNAPKQIEYELGVQVADMYSKDSFPTFGHPLQPQILERELLKAGFIIESLGYATLNNIKSPLTYQEHEFYVMNECDHGSEVEFTQSMIESKLSLHKEFKVLLEEDKKTYCAYKELHKNGGPSTQALKENCKIVIKNCIPQQDQKTILSQLETASMQDSFSPAQFIEDLRQLYPFCPKVDQSASPSSVYYFLNKTLFGLRSMATVQAIVKKPATD